MITKSVRVAFRSDCLGASRYKIARFWRHVDKDLPIDCWVWIGARNSLGFGIVGVDLLYAHRVAWALAHDKEIPKGARIRQKCGVRACCNPAHLKCIKRKRHP